jgi:hypothetical protein
MCGDMLLILGSKWTSNRHCLESYTWKVCCYSFVCKYSSHCACRSTNNMQFAIYLCSMVRICSYQRRPYHLNISAFVSNAFDNLWAPSVLGTLLENVFKCGRNWRGHTLWRCDKGKSLGSKPLLIMRMYHLYATMKILITMYSRGLAGTWRVWQVLAFAGLQYESRLCLIVGIGTV